MTRPSPGALSRRNRALLELMVVMLIGGAAGFSPGQSALPIHQAHAHNDYEHPRPLLDALAQGFCSVEADVYLVNGQLLVAHDLEKTSPARTLQALYLEPLRQRVKENKGRVHPDGPDFTLLIDLKSEAEGTYAVLRKILADYASMLTRFGPASTETNAVTVILSGNRPINILASETQRYAAIDGRLSDLENKPSRHLVPLVSDNWRMHFAWRGSGPFSDVERGKLKQLVEQAHQQGRRLRFWAAPDLPLGWAELAKAGVDLINTDDLAGLQQFLSRE